MLGTLALVSLILICIGAMPFWPWTRGWSLIQAGFVLMLIVFALVTLMLLERV